MDMKLRVHLAALTRMEYTTVVEVPDDTPAHKYADIVRDLYDKTDGTEFTEDNEYWERGHCWAERVPDDEED